MGVRNARVDGLDAVDGEDVAGGLAGELVGAMAGADGDGERVAVGLLDEIGGLRITSYNVCYTKLLRAGHGRRPQGIAQESVVPDS